MSRRAVTFDFHNTLIHCDEWFELEVRTLPSAFAAWHAEHLGPLSPGAHPNDFDATYRSLRAAIMEHGNELTAEQSLAVVYEQAGVQVDAAILEQGVRQLMSAALEHAEPVPGAVDTVRQLFEQGVPMGVVSSAVYHPFLEWALERFTMRRHFEIVVTSASCGFYKSRPEIYWHALEALGARPETSIHVGDSMRFDVGGGAKAGMKTVWLDQGTAPGSDFSPDLTLSTLDGAAPAIFELLGPVQ